MRTTSKPTTTPIMIPCVRAEIQWHNAKWMSWQKPSRNTTALDNIQISKSWVLYGLQCLRWTYIQPTRNCSCDLKNVLWSRTQAYCTYLSQLFRSELYFGPTREFIFCTLAYFPVWYYCHYFCVASNPVPSPIDPIRLLSYVTAMSLIYMITHVYVPLWMYISEFRASAIPNPLVCVLHDVVHSFRKSFAQAS